MPSNAVRITDVWGETRYVDRDSLDRAQFQVLLCDCSGGRLCDLPYDPRRAVTIHRENIARVHHAE